MEIKLLEAISQMISISKEPEVKCAKIMLDKIIEGMKPVATMDTDNVYPPVMQPTMKAKEKDYLKDVGVGDTYFPVINTDNKNKFVKLIIQEPDGNKMDAPDNFLVILDGVSMTIAEARGKEVKSQITV